MAKEFKDYDKLFAEFSNTFLSDEDEFHTALLAKYVRGWPFPWAQPSQEDVQQAVYEAVSAPIWQQFRVSLQGFPTDIKIARLLIRYEWNIMTRSSNTDEFKYEVTRINNYIGALKRGGQLNDNLEIAK